MNDFFLAAVVVVVVVLPLVCTTGTILVQHWSVVTTAATFVNLATSTSTPAGSSAAAPAVGVGGGGVVAAVVDAFCLQQHTSSFHSIESLQMSSSSSNDRKRRVTSSMTTTPGFPRSSRSITTTPDSLPLMMRPNDSTSDNDLTTSSSTSTPITSTNVELPPSFDEQSYEQERLEKDQQAMSAMEEEAMNEYAKLRTPWKWQLRKRIWDYMESNDVAEWPRPVHHRIPNFKGAQQAATRLSSLPEFQIANLIKVNPDTPQRPVRHLVLQSGKTLLTPQPRLRTGFFSTLNMETLPSSGVKIEDCTTSKGVAKYGTPVTLNDTSYKVDMVVVGSTAVCPRTGARVGKGEGFAELEWGILTEQENLDPKQCLVVTTVHDCQVIDDESDMPIGWKLTKHDVPVDIIVTPTRTIRVVNTHVNDGRDNKDDGNNGNNGNNGKNTPAALLLPQQTPTPVVPKPSGIYWDLLSPQKLAQIKVLRQLKDMIESQLQLSTGKKLPTGPDEVLPPVAKRSSRRSSSSRPPTTNKKKNKKEE